MRQPHRTAGSSRPEAAFTLVEVVVALSLLGVLAAVLAAVFLSGMRSSADLQRRQTGITLAEQAMELATNVPTDRTVAGCVPLLAGRTQDVVQAQWARRPGGVDLSSTDPVWDAPGCPTAVTVPLAGIGTPVPDDDVTPATTRLGAGFVVRTFVGTCLMPRGGGDCGPRTTAPAGAVELYRVVVSVQWEPGCADASCRYVLTELVDPAADPAFNARTTPTPTAVADTVCVTEGTMAMLSLLGNDTGSLGAAPVTLVSPPTRGTLGATLDTGYFSYQPAVGVVGVSDAFSYRLEALDGRVSNVAVVTVQVRPVGGCP